MMPYIPQDILDEVREAYRQGARLDRLAGEIPCDIADLRRLLGIPAIEPPTAADGGQLDLWSVDRLQAQL